MDRQLTYRELVPMTWDQYLNEPVEVVEWTIRIANMRAELQNEQRQQQGQAPHGAPRVP